MEISKEDRENLKLELLAEIKAEEEAEKSRIELLKKEAALQARRDLLIKEEARKQVEKEFKESQEPWVEIKGVVKDPVHGIKIELDWNDSFVKYLKENGIDGPSDDVIVQRWLEIISREVATDMVMSDAEKSISGDSSFE